MNVVAEACWLRNLLLELHCPLWQATIVSCDNVSGIYLSRNPVQHQSTSVLRWTFILFEKMLCWVKVLYVHTRYHFADIFTKGLRRHLFLKFNSILTVRPPPTMAAGVSDRIQHYVRYILFLEYLSG